MKGPYTRILVFAMLFFLGVLVVIILLRAAPSKEERAQRQVSIVFINTVEPIIKDNTFYLEEERPEFNDSIEQLNRILREYKLEKIIPDPRSPHHFKASFPPDTQTQNISEQLQNLPIIFFAQPISFRAPQVT